jgi:hypothetical protein
MNKQISEVHFYQGVKFGGSVIKFIALDSAFSDARLRKGDIAELLDFGVKVSNDKREEEILVPFNNVAFVKMVKQNSVEVKKSK